MYRELTEQEIDRIANAEGQKQTRNTDAHIRKLLAEREHLLSHIRALEDELNDRKQPKHKPTEHKG